MDHDLVAALHALPEHYREAVLLSDVEGLSYAEMAQRMCCPLGTVMSRLHRGRLLLRRALTQRDRPSEVRVARPCQSGQPLRAVA
jgi:RNA polymerase sigma-70 factor (ECF subfamily)